MKQLAILFPEPVTSEQLAACADLQRLIDRERESFRCEDYRRRRAAALKHRRGVA